MCAPIRSSQSGLVRLIGGALLVGAQAVVAPMAEAGGGIRLRELLVNPLGADRGQEFIEISGPPGASMSGISIVVIEGDATATSGTQKGRIDNALNLGSHAIGQSGLMLLRDGIGIIDCDPGPDVAGPFASTTTVIFASSATQSGFGNGSVGLENSSSTVLLVVGFSGAVGQDLDQNNDGILDTLPWAAVLDAVSVINTSTGPISQAVGYAPQFGGVTLSALATGFEIPMLVRREDGSWITAPVIGTNPTTGPPTSQDSGPYFWLPGEEHPQVGGAEYLMTPGQPNGAIPNGKSPCGSMRVVVGEGINPLWSNWGHPTFDLAGSPVQFDVPPGSSVRQAVGAAVRASFTASLACRYRFDLCASEIDDTVMVALSACGDATTAFALNDDSSQVCGEGSNRSSLDLELAAGQVVELAVGTYMYASDPFALEAGAITLRIRRDSDSDGTFDEDDGCPLEPALVAPLEYQIDADLDGYGTAATGSACALSPPDGYASNAADCDDADALSFPGASEVCDTQDNDCDGYADEGVQTLYYADLDGDGAGDPSSSSLACSPPAGYVANADDGCPLEPLLLAPAGYFIDADGDGYGAAKALLCATAPPGGFAAQGADCDDQSADARPGLDEYCATLGTDNDCDGDTYDVSVPETYFRDTDGDGYGAGDPVQGCPMPDGYARAGGDCDDGSALRWPGAAESCDDIGVDNDCDGDGQELTHPRTYYRDSDGDGAGDPLAWLSGCSAPDGYVSNADDECPSDPGLIDAVVHHPDSDGDGYGAASGSEFCSVDPPSGFLSDSYDCNDARADAYPGGAELCSNWPGDNDCDGDAYDAIDPLTFYLDADGDGVGDSAVTIQSCAAPPGYVSAGGDGCPLNPFAQSPIPWHRDQDNDYFGNAAVFIISCIQPPGYIPEDTDCDDTRPSVNPQGQERCDPVNLDEDCDGLRDNADPSATGQTPWYEDSDGDGYGAGPPVAACDAPSDAHVAAAGDCDDMSSASMPGAMELCATIGADNDCDGDAYDIAADATDRATWFRDADGDGAGDPQVTTVACSQPDGYVASAGDGCPEQGALTAPVTYFVDGDGDGYGLAAVALHCSTTAPDGYSVHTGDCNDDADAEGSDAYPGAAELCATIGADNDCDGDAYEVASDAADRATYFVDADDDGYGTSTTALLCGASAPDGYSADAGDCNDDPAAGGADAYPGAAELCATIGADNDCDGDAYEVAADAADRVPHYADTDGDGYTLGTASMLCASDANVGYAPAMSSPLDCNDDPAAGGADAYPGAAELCATIGADNDCDGDAYEVTSDAADRATWYLDADGDGAGDPQVTAVACSQPDGYVPAAGDACPDEGALTAPVPYFVDGDSDGYGTSATAQVCSSVAPDGYADATGDCDDGNPSVRPGAAESCNGIDDDCAGGPDDGLEFRDYYADADGDGYGDDSYSVHRCSAPGAGWADVGGDGCPADPAKRDPGACGCGTADTDGDSDGTADCIDNCTDLYNPGQGDCDSDGYGDACAIAAGAGDCNANLIPDTCDIASGASADVDGDGQPDSCQPDCNANGRPDAWEIAQGLVTDCDANSVPDDCEDGTVRADTGLMGALASGVTLSATLTGQARATTSVALRVDVIAGLGAAGASVRLELNGIAAAESIGAGGGTCPSSPDTYATELTMVDWMQVMDAASVPGQVVVRLVANDAVSAAPCGNAVARVRLEYGGDAYDCDGDGASDFCQLASGTGDCDENGVFDACEAGGPGDTDADGIPDSCEIARGDFNLDGVIDGTDLSFVLSAWGTTGEHEADVSGNGVVGGEDLAVLLAAWGTLIY